MSGKPTKNSKRVSDKVLQLKKEAFLKAFVETASISKAAVIADITRQSHYDWLRDDPDYPARFAEAHQKACEVVDAEIRRRGMRGVKKPVFYQGSECGAVREYSDVLLMFYAKGLMPDKYKERRETEHKGSVNLNAKWIPTEQLRSAAMADLNRFMAEKEAANHKNGNGKL